MIFSSWFFSRQVGRRLLCLLVAGSMPTLGARAEPPESQAQLPAPRRADSPRPQSLPDLPAPLPVPGEPLPPFTRAAALAYALHHNPMLATTRQQRGIAAAGLVIAKQYPFNPIYQSFIMADGGPADAGITNRVFNEHVFRLDLELRGQGRHRQAAAVAALSRTEWEIANQEVTVGIGAIRAFNGVLYRQAKLQVLEETVRLNEEMVKRSQRLVDLGKLRPPDQILARTEVNASRAVIGQGRTNLAIARSDLRRFLGRLDDFFTVEGQLDAPSGPPDPTALMTAAVQQRPDLRSRQAAIGEAEARWQLECANRFGNPSLGPAMEYNETKVTFVGGWLVTPLPIINTRRGEILQREAELVRARQELTQFEIQTQQDVQAALARLADARKWADSYEKEALPNLSSTYEDLQKLFTRGEPGVDVLKLIDVQRRYLLSYSAFLDARFEVSQALADLAAAVGDPSLALVSGSPPEPSHEAPPPAKAP
jgi:outer membrane protein TolC